MADLPGISELVCPCAWWHGNWNALYYVISIIRPVESSKAFLTYTVCLFCKVPSILEHDVQARIQGNTV